MSLTKEQVITRLARAWSHACDAFEIARDLAICGGDNDLRAQSELRASAAQLDRAERALRRAMTAYDAGKKKAA